MTEAAPNQKIAPVWILSTSRSGSTLLARLLNATGLFHENGKPDSLVWREYFAPKTFRDEYIQNPPRFNKIQLEHFLQYFGDLRKVEALLPNIRLIHLERVAYLEAAVSHYLCLAIERKKGTAIYNIFHDDELQTFRNEVVDIDKNLLQQCIRQYAAWHKGWEKYLVGREKLSIEYTELAAEPRKILNTCLDYLRLPQTAPHGDVPLPKKLQHCQRQELLALAHTILTEEKSPFPLAS